MCIPPSTGAPVFAPRSISALGITDGPQHGLLWVLYMLPPPPFMTGSTRARGSLGKGHSSERPSLTPDPSPTPPGPLRPSALFPPQHLHCAELPCPW